MFSSLYTYSHLSFKNHLFFPLSFFCVVFVPPVTTLSYYMLLTFLYFPVSSEDANFPRVWLHITAEIAFSKNIH